MDSLGPVPAVNEISGPICDPIDVNGGVLLLTLVGAGFGAMCMRHHFALCSLVEYKDLCITNMLGSDL